METIDGLYRADFITPAQHGYGILVVSNGSARGGDSIVCYDGTYTLSGTDVTFDLDIFRHSSMGTMSPIFESDSVTLKINTKRLEDGRLAGIGESPEAPGIPMKIVLTKLRD